MDSKYYHPGSIPQKIVESDRILIKNFLEEVRKKEHTDILGKAIGFAYTLQNIYNTSIIKNHP